MLFFGFIRTVRIILKPSSYTPNSRLERVGKLGMCKEVKTRVLRICPQNHELTSQQQREWMEVLSSTTEALKAGLVVALPTDTIYGLACAAQNSAAVQRVYDIKGRSGDKPLAICVGEIQDIYRYCKVCVKEELLSDLLPGPVTLVLERSAALNADLNPFTKLIGVRIPDHPFMRRLCQTFGDPLALTSANVSAQTSTVAASEFEDLWPSLAVVVDGGPIGDQSRLGSTVVDLSVCGRYRIIRPGCALSATVKVLEGKYGLLEDPVYQ
ncbi:yrdC domain-containing protein, mitochondrial isoform X1 [Pseudorasbora parva]|uniref:yrdC domain-containing protein, mitochondrial isoform X1 n=1 Tax=Pseudorasbora parva TaxID=51549 RepID=UPI00351F7C85